MNRRLVTLALVVIALAMAAPAMAAEEGAGGGKIEAQFYGAAFAIGVAAAFGSLGQGRGLAAACDAIGRNPGAQGPIRTNMIIGLALIESLVIYALVIAFMILAG